MNSLLERQLRKHVGGSASIPDEWKRFVEAVEHAYNQFDDDRKMLERSLDLSSAELCQANAQMRAVFESERHRLDEALRRLRDQHTLILYSIGDGVHGIDRDGNIIIENPAAAKLLGYETDELVGKPAHETVHHHWAQGGAHAKEDCPCLRRCATAGRGV